jgi:phosphoglycolate phosphatase-like HAD superfamily hydrolase
VTVWAFDLDGTLIGSIRNDRLRPGARELLAALAERGVQCVLWSAGGASYVERKAREHGIADAFVAFYDKAERDLDQRYLVGHFAPEHRPDVFVDDSPRDITAVARVIRVPQFMGGNDADRSLLDVLDLELVP